MGSFLSSFFFSAEPEPAMHGGTYSIFDPTQHVKPAGRTKDIIAVKNAERPHDLDRTLVSGCDTIWKNFKRSVWRHADKPFLGVR